MATLERSLKQFYDRLCLSSKQKKAIKLAPAISAVMILLLILSGLIIVNVRSLYETSSTISSVGTLRAIGVEVYTDERLTTPATSVKWGFLTPSAKKTSTIYIRNEGNVPLAVRLFTENWRPSTASDYLTLTWNFNNGQKIDPEKFAEVTLTLTVDAGITGITSFNYDLIVEGSG